MKKSLLLIALVSVFSMSAFAGSSTCYQLSEDGNGWSRTPEEICVSQVGNRYEVTLETGLSFNRTTVATFNLDLVSAARCIDCNMNVYGVSNPSNSIFNELKISFNGKRDIRSGEESGTVTVGSNKFFYKN